MSWLFNCLLVVQMYLLESEPAHPPIQNVCMGVFDQYKFGLQCMQCTYKVTTALFKLVKAF
jgi:hypothetical protein